MLICNPLRGKEYKPADIIKLTFKQATAPPYLKPGDTVAITCPAKKLPGPINDAVKLLESWGLNVLSGDTINASWHQFAGTDQLRAADFQRFLDDRSVKAIFAARGGYGTIRIIDKLDFSGFQENPKWIIGFSDITILHSHIHAVHNVQSIHGQMPLTIPDGSKISLETLRKALFNDPVSYTYESKIRNRQGTATGILTGGNLTLLLMMSGSVSEQDYSGKILFLEDVGEYLYSIDRMMLSFKRAGILARLKGLIIGGFTELKDNDIPFGQTAEQIIMSHVEEYDYPICFNFPAGHIPDNRAMVFGKKATLTVDEFNVSLGYTDNNNQI